jgi:hypothetical protein
MGYAVAGAVTLGVPRLWLYEVGNTLARRFPQQAENLLAALVDFGLGEARETAQWRRQAPALVLEHGVTFHDATQPPTCGAASSSPPPSATSRVRSAQARSPRCAGWPGA